jgi:hypothetical protein
MLLRGAALLHFGVRCSWAQSPGRAGCPCIEAEPAIAANYGDTSSGAMKLRVDIGGVKYLYPVGYGFATRSSRPSARTRAAASLPGRRRGATSSAATCG